MPSFRRTSGSGEKDFKMLFFSYNMLAWRPPWSCDLDHLYNPPAQGGSTLHLALTGQAVSEEMLEIVDDDDNNNGRRSMGIL